VGAPALLGALREQRPTAELPEHILPGPRHLWHARRNSDGYSDAEAPARRVKVTVRLDVRLPAAYGGRASLPVPSLHGNYAVSTLFNPATPYKGVGQSSGRAVQTEQCSEVQLSSMPYCGRCLKQLLVKSCKVLNKGGWYKACSLCDQELRAGPDNKAQWDCPTAANGEDGCACCTTAKQAGPRYKRKSMGFTNAKVTTARAKKKKGGGQ
jgi:hypothetical protein